MIQCIIDTSLISELISLSELMTEFLGQIFGPNFWAKFWAYTGLGGQFWVDLGGVVVAVEGVSGEVHLG